MTIEGDTDVVYELEDKYAYESPDDVPFYKFKDTQKLLMNVSLKNKSDKAVKVCKQDSPFSSTLNTDFFIKDPSVYYFGIESDAPECNPMVAISKKYSTLEK